MKKMRIFTLFIPLFLGLFSCKKDGARTDALPIDFKLRLLNTNGQESTHLTAGENFTLSFLIINQGDKDLYFDQASIKDPDFFEVYRLDNSESNAAVKIGKPYQSIFCTYQDGIPIASKDTLKLEIPWISASDFSSPHFCLVEQNNFLPAGKYQTKLNSSFAFFKGDESYHTDNLHFNIDFEVK